MRYSLLTILAITVFLPLNMAIANPYVVKNIAVDASGDGTIAAREKALTKARRNGFTILTKRLAAPMREADDNAIASMVDSFEINREKASKDRYMASVNVRFNERAVQAFMGSPTVSPMATQLPFATQSTTQNASSARSVATKQYKISFEINNLAHLINIQNQLRTIPNVNTLVAGPMNIEKGIVTLNYGGNAQQLQNDLNARGMQIYSNPQAKPGEAPYILIEKG